MKTPNELRTELAKSQRMKKTQEKWLGFCKRLEDAGCWSEKSEIDGCKIGDKVKFTETKPSGRGCFCMSQREGVAFAFGENHMIVVYRGDMKRIRLEV